MSFKSEKIPLIETFGPVLQGEGQLIGKPTWFVRLGACDYTCIHCDSMHAVDPKQIEARATIMSARAIGERVVAEMNAGRVQTKMATLSGGNPALWDLTDFVHELQAHTKTVAIETQGTVYQPWIAQCDYITISPKGPSMIGYELAKGGLQAFRRFFEYIMGHRAHDPRICIKIPVFNSADLMFAEDIIDAMVAIQGPYHSPVYLSTGNISVGQGLNIEALRKAILESFDKLSTLMMIQHPKLQGCSMFPQLHVLVYGNELRR